MSGPRPPGQGFAVASFVLGVCALIWAMIAVGGLFGAVGLVLGILHLRRSEANRPLATWGITLSIVGILGSLLATAFYAWIFSNPSARSRVASGKNRTAFAAWAGVAAPPLTVRTIDGEEVTLASLRGRPVVLNFWATWCGPCRKEVPHLDRLARESAVAVIALSQESADTVRAYRQAHGLGYTFAVGKRTELPEPFVRVRSVPTTVFIDRNGVIREILVGALNYEALYDRATAPDLAAPPRPAPGASAPPDEDED